MAILKLWKRSLMTIALAAPLLVASGAQALQSDEDDPATTLKLGAHMARINSGADGSGGVLGSKTSGPVLGIDTLPNWSSYFYFPGLAVSGNFAYPQWTWQYSMVGRSPVGTHDHGDDDDGMVTRIRAPIVPVIIDLRDYDGSPRYYPAADGTPVRMILDPTNDIQPVLASPIFAPASYSSSRRPTQYTDAVQKAEFYNTAGGGWHTLLVPVVTAPRTIVLIRGTYRFRADPVTGKVRYVTVDENVFGAALFPATPDDTSTVMGAVEHSGEVLPTDLATFLFDNVFLYSNGNPADCCIIGYHSYDAEPGSAANGWRERHFVMNYSSWISPGIFRGGFSDVTALSHELAETFNDPFTTNATPIWVAPFGLCQNNLEVGDVIEGLANATYPMTMNGMTYHPQNVALVPWFAGIQNSGAINGAYSYPDTTVLTTPAVSTNTDCATPFTIAKH